MFGSKIPIVILFIFSLNSCTQVEKEYKMKISLIQLQKEDLYNFTKISDYLFDAKELDNDSLRKESSKLFLKGIDFLKNKKNPKAAIEYLKKSIILLPEPKYYFELGNALMLLNNNKEKLKEAEKAFKMAERFKYEPLYKINYNMASLYLTLHKLGENNYGTNEVLWELNKAFKNGFVDTLALEKDQLFNQITYFEDYKKMKTSLLFSGNKVGNSLFKLFKLPFGELKTNFEIKPIDVDKAGTETISYEFASFIPEMENVSFGRDVSHDFLYVSKVAETEAYTALIYSSVNFYGGDMQPIQFKICTYNFEGKIIDSRIFACSCSAEKIKVGKIENNILVIKELKRRWQFPIDEISFEKNSIIGYDVVSEFKSFLQEDGTFVDESISKILIPSKTFAIK